MLFPLHFLFLFPFHYCHFYFFLFFFFFKPTTDVFIGVNCGHLIQECTLDPLTEIGSLNWKPVLPGG